MAESGRYPVGIPLVPPPGWRGRRGPVWRAVLLSALLTMVGLLCVMAGWLSVAGLPPRPGP